MTVLPRRLLAIGWDDLRHEACIRHDIELVAVCSAAEWDDVRPGTPEPTHVLLVNDHHNVGDVLAEIERTSWVADDFARVVTSDELAVPVAAVVALALGVPGIAPAVAVRFRDKHVQKTALASAGVAVPKFAIMNDVVAAGVPEAWNIWPAIVKPVSGGGAGSTVRCDDQGAAERFIDAHREAGATAFFGGAERKFMIEGFSEGTEWHIDGYVHEGEVVALSVGRYLVAPLVADSNRVLRTAQFDQLRDAWAYELARPFAERALAVLGLDEGVFHMEAFHGADAKHLVFGECAARIPGGLIPEVTLAKTGIDLPEMEVLYGIGEAPVARSGAYAHSEIGLTYLPAPPGLLLRAPSEENICAESGVVYATEPPPIGSTLGDMSRNSSVKLAQAIVVADTLTELERRMDDVVAWSATTTSVVRPDATVRELCSIQ